MNHRQWLSLIILFGCRSIFAQEASNIEVLQIKPFSIGETIEFHSEVLQENRDINIYLPHGFSRDSIRRYPVIYLLDGSTDEDFIHIAGLVQFGSFPWIEMLPESIVVGIANVDRRRDFTYPTNNQKDKADFPTTGGSAQFIDFIGQELQPFVDTHYPVQAPKTIIGQSLGGLLATEVLFRQPDLFDNYIIVSPSLWWDDESLLQVQPQTYESSKSIYIAVGKEGDIMERTAKALYDMLVAPANENANLYFEYFEKQDHGNVLHLAVYSAFEKIFKIENLSKN